MKLNKVREDLHKIPELGMQEIETKKYILNIVKNYKCKIYEIGKTGVVCFFDFEKKESICFRADMDGLPIKENNDVAYKSTHNGLMHACGHDGHMTMLLGLCEYLNELNECKYNIVCLFQPSEEIYGGSKLILDSNILDELNVKYMFGMHIWPSLEKGKLFTMPKGILAKSCEVNIKFFGKEVHAADKNKGIDSIKAAAEYLLDVYNFEENINENHLLHFGKINGGTLRNIVAGYTELNATMRAFDENTYHKMEKELLDLKINYEHKYGVKIDIEFNGDFPCVYNDEELVKKMHFANLLEKPFMQAEDFGAYTSKYKSCFFLLGCGNTPNLHMNNFDFDMTILDEGLKYYKLIIETISE